MKQLIVALVLLTACDRAQDELPYYLTPELTPQFVSREVASSSDAHRVGTFELTSNTGARINGTKLDGKVSIIHFFFTECSGVCPKTQPNLAWLLKQIPAQPELQILSHSVQPEADSVAALRAYASEHRIADPRWILLTGSRPEIERVAEHYYYANLNDGRSYGVSDLAHTETLYLIDQNRMIRGVYNGTLRLDVERLRDDALRLIKSGP